MDATNMSKKQRFLTNPIVDPVDGKTIVVNKGRYKELANKYGEPNKIKSLKSQKLIGVGKGEWKKLMKEGYTPEQLIHGNIVVKMVSIDNKSYPEEKIIKMIEFYEKAHPEEKDNAKAVDNKEKKIVDNKKEKDIGKTVENKEEKVVDIKKEKDIDETEDNIDVSTCDPFAVEPKHKKFVIEKNIINVETCDPFELEPKYEKNIMEKINNKTEKKYVFIDKKHGIRLYDFAFSPKKYKKDYKKDHKIIYVNDLGFRLICKYEKNIIFDIHITKSVQYSKGDILLLIMKELKNKKISDKYMENYGKHAHLMSIHLKKDVYYTKID
jgi:hypothetical protein